MLRGWVGILTEALSRGGSGGGNGHRRLIDGVFAMQSSGVLSEVAVGVWKVDERVVCLGPMCGGVH